MKKTKKSRKPARRAGKGTIARKARVVTKTVYPAMTPENDALIEKKRYEIDGVMDATDSALTELQGLGLPQEVIDEIEDRFLDVKQLIEDLQNCIRYGYPKKVKVRRGSK